MQRIRAEQELEQREKDADEEEYEAQRAAVDRDLEMLIEGVGGADDDDDDANNATNSNNNEKEGGPRSENGKSKSEGAVAMDLDVGTLGITSSCHDVAAAVSAATGKSLREDAER